MSVASEDGIVAGVRIDLQRLHETWMEVVFPRQRDADRTVLGKWRPTTTRETVTYRFWSALGIPVVGVLYPLLLFGYVVRYQVRRIDSTAARLGVLGVVVVSVVVWGLLTLISWFRLPGLAGFIAVAAASVVATVAAGLAVVTAGVAGRKTTVGLSYPFAMTAIFLPPVVAALYSPAVADVVLPRSTAIARWINDNLLAVGGIGDYLRRQYDLRGIAYVGMWFGIAVPVGWLLGFVVTLADLVRPE